MLVYFLEISFKLQLVCKFDITENTHFALFLILFMHMYLHISWYIAIWLYIVCFFLFALLRLK